jgi:putative membrane protein
MTDYTGYLGDAYLWVKAGHVIFVMFWMAGMFMLPRYFVYHHRVQPGSPEDALWIERERRLMCIIINPAMIIAWIFGLMLAFNLGWEGVWLHVKFAIVLGFSGFHGWLARLRKQFIAGQRPVTERRLRLLNEIPGIVIALAVILVIVRPF